MISLLSRITAALLCILCICSFNTNAQNNNYNFSRVDIENGLSNNQVYSIYRDSTGFVWIGTASGLNRFDGYNCKVFSHNLNDSNSIPDNIVLDIFGLPGNKMWIVSSAGISVYDASTEIFDRQYQRHLKYLNLPQSRILYSIKDKIGNYWFLFENNVLYQYVVAEQRAIRVIDIDKNLTGKNIDYITEDFSGNIWLVYSNGYVALLNPNTMSPVLQSTDLAAMLPNEKLRLTIFADRLQNLWIYSRDEPLGLYNINTSTKVVRHLSKSSGVVKLNDNMIRGVVQDDKGIIWVATDHGGINLIDEKDNSISYLVNQENNRASLGYNSIEKIYNDNHGLIWVGTGKKGVSYFNQNIVQFGLYRHETDNKNSLPYSDINSFQEDRKGNVWIGTNGGGLIYFDRVKQTFKQYVNNPGDPNSLAGNIIVSLCLDHEDKLWIGTFLGGLDVFDGKSFTHYRHNPSDPGSIGDNSVWDIQEDHSHTIWLGTLKSGLDRFDRQTKKFIHYTNGTTPLSTHCNYIPDIFEDKDGNLWLSTSEGIEVLNKERTKFSFYNHSNDPKSLSYQNVTNITQDKRGLIWVATRMGLNVFNSKTQQFKRFTTNEGLPENIILAITEDLKGNLWITTPKGLCQLIVKTEKEDVFVEVRNFTETNNVQGKVFNESALATTLDGLVFVGGSTGFNIIDPTKIVSGKSIPPLVFTGIDIFNNEVNAGQSTSDNVVLRNALPFSNEVFLNHNENIFSIEFASLDFSHNNQYAYKLEGFNNSWMYTNSNNRKVTYTNIDPGTYCFKVKTTNSDGIWGNEEKTLNIIIKPPFWKTPMAFFVYILVLAAILYLARRYTLEKAKMRFEVALQRKERERIQALDAVKTKFFTNVSHEFRTPLSLILAPLDRIIHGSTDPEQKKQIQLVQRNAKRLLALVNQLLDFRKMEVQEFKLQTTQGDIIKFIKEISSSFSDLSEMKNISLTFSANIDYFLTYFDKDKLEKILFNLLSNAFKYTHGGGQIEVHVEHTEMNDAGDAQVKIVVTDSGIGIPADKQEMIFERFFQNNVSANLTNPGTGIGLAITKEFVKLHHGTVTVSSEPNKGTSFVVTLPLKKLTNSAVHAEVVNELITPVHEENGVEHKTNNGQQIKRTRPVILLAEDDDDFRFYLKDNLKHVYDVVETMNGQEAWEKLEKIQPDLIISDVMMPQMDGIELASRVRKNPLLASVPVVLLTAVGDEEMQLESYRLGVSDYIIKPFTYEILASRIKNLLDQSKLPSKKSHKLVDVTPSNIEIPPADEQFLKQVLQVIEKNISNPEFTVEELSKELFMHRVGMYRKLLSITGISPLEFIRNIRLKRGRQLLESSQLTISEVAYEVGFNNPKKFSQHFKEEFGVTPSQFQKQHTNGV